MFVQECILRNVGEAKMYVMLELTIRGYSPMYMKFENNVGGNNIVCEGQTWHCTDSDKPYCIDCGENINLFLAIASLRDDTDKYQWFTDGRITVRGRIVSRGAKKRTDYILYNKSNNPLAVVEAKSSFTKSALI
jgi:hypothetical protein